MIRAALAAGVLAVSAACGSEVPAADSPLSPQLFLSGDQAAVNDALLERELQFQDLVAECMRRDGFDYFPVDDSKETEAANAAFNEIVGAEAVGLSYGLPSAEYAERWGFGIARRMNYQWGGLLNRPPDRNAEYVDSLDPAAAGAYAESLGRCEQEADESVFAPIDEFETIAAAIGDDVQERLRTDPDVQAADIGWEQCVATTTIPDMVGGLPERPVDLLVAFEEKVLELDLSLANDAELDNFAQLEREAATLSVRCADSVDYRSVVLDRARALEQEALEALGYG